MKTAIALETIHKEIQQVKSELHRFNRFRQGVEGKSSARTGNQHVLAEKLLAILC